MCNFVALAYLRVGRNLPWTPVVDVWPSPHFSKIVGVLPAFATLRVAQESTNSGKSQNTPTCFGAIMRTLRKEPTMQVKQGLSILSLALTLAATAPAFAQDAAACAG